MLDRDIHEQIVGTLLEDIQLHHIFRRRPMQLRWPKCGWSNLNMFCSDIYSMMELCARLSCMYSKIVPSICLWLSILMIQTTTNHAQSATTPSLLKRMWWQLTTESSQLWSVYIHNTTIHEIGCRSYFHFITNMWEFSLHELSLKVVLPCIFKVNKPGIQADRIFCLSKILAYSPFWESQTVHCP